jgi:hypothetical protein
MCGSFFVRYTYTLIHALHMPFLQGTTICVDHNLLYFDASSSRFCGMVQFLSQLFTMTCTPWFACVVSVVTELCSKFWGMTIYSLAVCDK